MRSPEALRVVLRLVGQLLRGIREVPEAPGVGRDPVVDAEAQLERRTERAADEADEVGVGQQRRVMALRARAVLGEHGSDSETDARDVGVLCAIARCGL